MAVARKITPKLGKKSAPAPVKAPEAKAAAKPVVVAAKKDAKPRVSTFKAHAVASGYQGPSTGLNKRKSLAAIPHNEFGSKPDYVLTERTEAVAKALKNTYGKNAFPRLNLDAGILKFLVWRGAVQPVSGDGRSAEDTYRFV